MQSPSPQRHPDVLKLVLSIVALCSSLSAEAQFTVAGLAIGQEVKACPPPAAPIRKDACESGIACRYPQNSAAVLGTLAKHLSFATDSLGRVESVVAWGFDAPRAVAQASEAYGAPDMTETRNKSTYWGWMRGDVRLVIFHTADEQDGWSSVNLDRVPQGVSLPCSESPR